MRGREGMGVSKEGRKDAAGMAAGGTWEGVLDALVGCGFDALG